MRVYQINVVCGNGSTGRIVADLSHAIQSSGGECRIAYGRGEAPADIEALKISDKHDIYYHALMTRLTDRHGLYSKGATKRLIEDIVRYQPDIIHLHNIHGYYVNYELLFQFLKEYSRPVVWTLHDCWAFTGHCAHYDAIGCEQWEKECHHCTNMRTYPSSFAVGNVYSNFVKKKACFSSIDRMIMVTPSVWLKTQVERSFLSGVKCVVIHNGIDLNQFIPKSAKTIRERLCPNLEKLVLGVASVWTANKGYYDFLKLRTLLDDNYVICMVGLNEKQMTKLPQGIIGIKKTESVAELAEYYSAADVFLNLTYEENFPTTNIESLACGTPVLTYETGGSPEIIDESCGATIKRGDLEEMARSVIKWCEGEKPIQKCVTRSRQYNKTERYSEYITLYGACLQDENTVFN